MKRPRAAPTATSKRRIASERSRARRSARVTAYGAAGEVTGSRYLVESGRTRVLLECGLFQGGPQSATRNSASWPFDPRSLDAVVISHAHLDHSGLLPRLVRDGFRGDVHVTPATRELLEIMLADAAYLAERDAEWESRRRRRAGRDTVEPLYRVEDSYRALEHCVVVEYGRRVEIAPDTSLTLHDAGHILGSAVVEIELEHPHASARLVFSGDLGNRDTALLRDPEPLTRADVLLLESTYGDRNHKSFEDTVEELAEVMALAGASGGNVLIPAFAVGRTQELLYVLGRLQREGRLPQRQVFLDSPMAIAATRAYDRNMQLYDRGERARFDAVGAAGLQQWLPSLRLTETPEQSMAINRVTGGAVIIAGSGMCTGGRIRHHLKHNLWRREAHLVFCGFQAARTTGRAIVDGARRVRLLGLEIAVRAQVHTLGGFSAHAGQDQLVAWAAGFQPRPRLYLVHGEPRAMDALAQRLEAQLGWDAARAVAGRAIALG